MRGRLSENERAIYPLDPETIVRTAGHNSRPAWARPRAAGAAASDAAKARPVRPTDHRVWLFSSRRAALRFAKRKGITLEES
jgi:hypothetical protein